jgi:hypothetical protein
VDLFLAVAFADRRGLVPYLGEPSNRDGDAAGRIPFTVGGLHAPWQYCRTSLSVMNLVHEPFGSGDPITFRKPCRVVTDLRHFGDLGG